MSPGTASVLSACVLLLSPAAALAQEVGAPPIPLVEGRFFVQTGRIVPFAQFLAGAAHARSKVTFPFGIDGRREFKENDTEFAIQPGGGVTVLLTCHVAVRGSFDYRRIFIEDVDDEVDSEIRASVGFVFG